MGYDYTKFEEYYESKFYFVGRYKSSGQIRIANRLTDEKTTVSVNFNIISVLCEINNTFGKPMEELLKELYDNYSHELEKQEKYSINGYSVYPTISQSNGKYQVDVVFDTYDKISLGSYNSNNHATECYDWIKKCLINFDGTPIVVERSRILKNNPFSDIIQIKSLGDNEWKKKYDPKIKSSKKLTTAQFISSRKNGGIYLNHQYYDVPLRDFLTVCSYFSKENWRDYTLPSLPLSDWETFHNAWEIGQFNKMFNVLKIWEQKSGVIFDYKHEDTIKPGEFDYGEFIHY